MCLFVISVAGMITDRQKSILKTLIEEHIKEAQPVGSEALAEKRDFNIGAAMLRKEMNQLEEAGYLAKPHTSAGRVPTDKAYRLYIQEQLSDNSDKTYKSHRADMTAGGLSVKETQKVSASLQKNWPDEPSLLKEISRLCAEISKDLSVAGTMDSGVVYSCGLARVIAEPEFQDVGGLGQLMLLMDNIDNYFDKLWEEMLDDRWNIFVGRENPIKEINELSLVTGRYQLPRGEIGFVSIIGPKRMDYRKNVGLVEYISRVMNGS